MEIDEPHKLNIKCFKSHVQCLAPLNIEHNASSTTFILWNKYEIYVYENLKFDSASTIILPEFQIFNLISTNNFIVCLDFEGNLHTTSMKFKQSASKRMKTNFLLKEKYVLSCALYSSEKLLSLKWECDNYYLCINYLNSEFDLETKIKLILPIENSQPSCSDLKSFILICFKLRQQYDNLIKFFKIDSDVPKDNNLIIISFDKRVLYGCLYKSGQVNEMILQNLFCAPSIINDVKVTEDDNGYIIVTLKSGTIIRLSLVDFNKSSDVVHLNIAISKCVLFNESIIYTDGMTMWISYRTFTEQIDLQKFHIKQVKDFICFGDQIICTTFTNLIYLFSVDNEMLIKSTFKYIEANKILNDTGCVYKILEKVEENYKLEEKLKEECNYITALSLSNRSDILDNVILYTSYIYNSYEEILKESTDVTLTERVEEYIKANVLCLLIKITLTFDKYKINDVLLQVLRDLQIHTTLLTSSKVMKTTSVRVVEEFKNVNLLIPLAIKNATSVTVNIKLLKRIPGTEIDLWTIIHQKEMILNAEHFIKLNAIKNNVTQLKGIDNYIEVINQIAFNSSGHLFKFTNTENKTQTEEFSFYLKLTNNFKEAFKNESYYKNIFNKEKALNILKENTSDDFLKGKNKKIFEIGNSKVKVEVINDEFTNTSLKVTCDDVKIGFHIKNFYSNLVYDNFSKCGPGKEFVRYTLYATIENIQKGIRQCISDGTDVELKSLLEQLQRHVYAAMPL